MKTSTYILTIGAIAGSLIIASIANAQPPRGGNRGQSEDGERGHRPPPPEMALAQHFEDADTDADGILTEAEITALFESLHAEHPDPRGDRPKANEVASMVLERLDTDGDDQVSKAELITQVENATEGLRERGQNSKRGKRD